MKKYKKFTIYSVIFCLFLFVVVTAKADSLVVNQIDSKYISSSISNTGIITVTDSSPKVLFHGSKIALIKERDFYQKKINDINVWLDTK